MLVLYYYKGIDSEWDDAKADSNWTKHEVSFVEAVGVFLDPYVHSVEDEGDYGEVREVVIGRLNFNTVLYVVYVNRGESLRIISARPATRAEIQRYEDG